MHGRRLSRPVRQHPEPSAAAASWAMANIPQPITVQSAASGKAYTVAVHPARDGFVADVLRSNHLVAKTSPHPTAAAAQTAGNELALTL